VPSLNVYVFSTHSLTHSLTRISRILKPLRDHTANLALSHVDTTGGRQAGKFTHLSERQASLQAVL